jgi:hypothetical protein
VIHAIIGSDVGAAEIPLLLQGKTPSPGAQENLGTKNYSQLPRAVFCGAAYGDEGFGKMRKACEGISRVPWLRVDLSIARPPVGPGYAEYMVGRVKAKMAEIMEEGKMDEDGVYFF